MILVEEAIKILRKVPAKPEIEEVSISLALNRILGQDIVSKIDMPPFNKSAMDGYAFHSSDSSDEFQIVEVISAGIVPTKKIQKGQCVKIMTGGIVPSGANRVIKKEVTVEEEGFMRIVGEDKNFNICYQGEDVKIGDVVMKKGVIIRPQEIGVIASMGMASLKVYKRPEVGIIATGSELVEPGNPLQQGQIYNSNAFSLAAQVIQSGTLVKSRETVLDTKKEIRRAIEKSLDACDMVIISGGVSAGEFDYVPNILKELGVQLHFEKIAIIPGKPTVFGTRGENIVFGVPGNPVSSFVIFEIFIKPFLFKMMGHNFHPKTIKGVMKEKFHRQKIERSAYIPIRYQEGFVELLTYHGSAHINALSQANGLISVARGVKEIPAGSTVNVRPIQ